MNDPSQQGYQYQPLHQEDGFRILELLPGISDAPLRCQIQEVSWRQNPEYEALSYAWGPPIFSKHVEETASDSILRVTENLFDALRFLRYDAEPRILWVDAICIDQSNATEKGHQVAQMGKIYKNAQSVAIWLGKEECNAAVNLLEELGRDYVKYGIPDTVNGKPVDLNPETYACQQELLYRHGGGCLSGFFERAWFERVWVIQEFTLPKIVRIHIGRRILTLQTFKKAMHVLWTLRDAGALVDKENSGGRLGSMLVSGLNFVTAAIQKAWQGDHEAVNDTNPLRLIDSLRINPIMLVPANILLNFREGYWRSVSQNMGNTGNMNILLLWSILTYAKCSHERDQLFGLLGLAENVHLITPDYESPIHKVWLDVSLKFLRDGDLSILHYCSSSPLSTRDTANAPSFVLNFSAVDRVPLMVLGGMGQAYFQAGLYSSQQVNPNLVEGRFPEIFGIHVDQATRISEKCVETAGSDTLLRFVLDIKTFRAIYSQCKEWVMTSAWPYNESLVDVFARTSLSNNQLTQADFPCSEEWIKVAFVLYFLGPWASRRDHTRIAKAEEMLGTPLVQLIKELQPDFFHYDSSTGDCDVKEALNRYDRECLLYQASVLQNLSRRVMFLTSKGYFGHGPDDMRETDWVIIPDGAETPFVVRPTGTTVDIDGEEVSMVQVLGDCYLHGWMYGDLFGHTVVNKVYSGNNAAGESIGAGMKFTGRDRPTSSGNTLIRQGFILC